MENYRIKEKGLPKKLPTNRSKELLLTVWRSRDMQVDVISSNRTHLLHLINSDYLKSWMVQLIKHKLSVMQKKGKHFGAQFGMRLKCITKKLSGFMKQEKKLNIVRRKETLLIKLQ